MAMPNAIERFERAHKRMVEDQIPIRPVILRAYLDTLLLAARKRSGLYNVRVTFSADTPPTDIAKCLMAAAMEKNWPMSVGR